MGGLLKPEKTFEEIAESSIDFLPSFEGKALYSMVEKQILKDKNVFSLILNINLFLHLFYTTTFTIYFVVVLDPLPPTGWSTDS